MTTKRWWDLVVAGSLAVMGLIAVFGTQSGTTGGWGSIATLVALGLCYLSFGRRSIGEQGHAPAHLPSAVAMRTALVLACGVGAAFDPNMATLQALAFPLLWTLTESYRLSLVLSGVLVTAVGVGMFVNLGGDFDALTQASAIAVISFAFAAALGTWITRIAHEAKKQRLLVAELTATQSELAAMHRVAGSAAEREHLAREIHDTIAQSLTSLVMLAQRTRAELAGISGAGPAETTVDLIESTARDALTEARTLVASMSSVRSRDSDSNLAEAVNRLAERFERETGIRVDSAVSAAGLDRELEVVLLRCTQEGLANVRKHSRAGAASVIISREGEDLLLEVRDNGRGLGTYAAEHETGFGLAGMRDRVGLVGGRLEVSDGPDGGVVLRVTVPAQVAERDVAVVSGQAETPVTQADLHGSRRAEGAL